MGLLEGKVAVVTGGGRGIGRGVARGLVREGAAVVIAEIDAKHGEQTTSELRAIVAAIGDGDGGKAARLAVQHVQNAADAALTRLAGQNPRDTDRASSVA